jgi:Domain of unknown function (DUF4397)
MTAMKRASGLVLLATVFALLSACGGGGAKLRVMNAAPDESQLDFLIDSNSFANNVAYGTSTQYSSVSTGSRNLRIDPDGSSTDLINESITLNGNSNSTLIAADFASDITALILTDDTSSPTSGHAKVRIVNVAPSLGTTDVYIVPPNTDLTTVSPNVSQLNFKDASGYQDLTAGTYEVLFTTPGTVFVLFDAGSFTLSAGQNRTIATLNNPSGGFQTSVLKDLN